MDLKIGEQISCCASIYDKPNPSSKIIFKLDRLLLDEVIEDEQLKEYACIIIDEAHERNVNSDVLLGFVKRACKINKDIRIIVTSATLDEKLFKNYFNNTKIIKVSGRMFPVEIKYKPCHTED